jgi:DNA-binding ferritin-like protein (Dps family)
LKLNNGKIINIKQGTHIFQFNTKEIFQNQESDKYISIINNKSIDMKEMFEKKEKIENKITELWGNWIEEYKENLINNSKINKEEEEKEFDEDFLKEKNTWGDLNKRSMELENEFKNFIKNIEKVIISDEFIDWSDYDNKKLGKKKNF